MKNFFDQNDEKITEKSFTRTLVISIISIALCIIALCSITFAWFSDETTSVSNTLSSGSFDITVSVLDPDGVDLSADYIDGDVCVWSDAFGPFDCITIEAEGYRSSSRAKYVIPDKRWYL